MSNAREEPVAVVGHEWTFTDEHGVQRHQKGAGLGGEHNVGKVRLDNQRALSYVARFKLPTRIAPRLDPQTRRLARWEEATAHASPRRPPPTPGRDRHGQRRGAARRVALAGERRCEGNPPSNLAAAIPPAAQLGPARRAKSR